MLGVRVSLCGQRRGLGYLGHDASLGCVGLGLSLGDLLGELGGGLELLLNLGLACLQCEDLGGLGFLFLAHDFLPFGVCAGWITR